MSINNNFIVQGTYTNNSNLSNILLNENVRTSSLITYNLIELIKSNYIGSDATLNLEQQDEYINSCFSNALENYIRDIIMDKYPSIQIATLTHAYSYMYLMFNANQPNDSLVVTSDKIQFNYIRKRYNGHVITDNLSSILFYKYLLDDAIQTTLNGKTINMKHYVFQSTYPYDRKYGATESMDSDGYDKSFPIAHFSCNDRGHVLSNVGNSTYTPPVRSYCIKELYSGRASLANGGISSGIITDDEIRYYTTLLITVEDESGNKTTHFVNTRDLARLGSNHNSYMHVLTVPFCNGCDCLFISCEYINSVRKYKFYSYYYWHWGGDSNTYSASSKFKYLIRIVGLIYGHQKQDTESEF